MHESHKLSLIKAISWRVFGTFTTVLVVFLMTHQLNTSIYVGALEMLMKIAIFYCHERVWVWLVSTQLTAKLTKQASSIPVP